MARHILTKEERIRGMKAAVASPNTPPQLKKGLRKKLKEMGEL